MDDWAAELLVLVRKQHAEQRREQGQEFIVVCPDSVVLQAGENLTKKFLQLQDSEGETERFV